MHLWYALGSLSTNELTLRTDACLITKMLFLVIYFSITPLGGKLVRKPFSRGRGKVPEGRMGVVIKMFRLIT